ncbi:restriction endonuclease subunit S [Psychrobacter halodurans]|uniref:Restriction endonuclease subunit S n=1 Tax=Psychrobacter halodurans TaxID=2818439 RepID=A0AAW4IQA0_9GAMM|nr:restriction endonuclease subunit S [Psychrobacter halodurans]MBO1515851.1 restriction endonuclease subunit S [Psychrobacter halodurans]
MVPNGWKVKSLQDIATISSGGTPSRSQPSYWENGTIPWVTTAEVNYQTIIDTEQKITKEGLDNSSAKLYSKDTILMAMYGQGKTRGQVAKLGIEASTNQACAAIQLKDNFNVDFYYQLLASQYKRIRHLANSGGQKNLSSTIIKEILVPTPPLPEQQKIAKILTTWDKAINVTGRLIDNSKQQKKSLMQQLLTGKKRLLDENGKRFEGEFNQHRLSELVNVDKKSLGKNTPEDYEFEYISLSDVSTGTISKSLERHVFSSAPSRARRIVKENDLLLATVRPNLKGFAKARKEHDGLVASTGFAVLSAKKDVSSDYVYHYLFSHHLTGQINALVVGSNYPAINSSDVGSLKILCPPFEEQQRIATLLTNADKEIELLERQLADLQQEKKALMQVLLTGKKRVVVDGDTA